MPNWTTNSIRILGDADVLKTIRDLVRGEPQGEDNAVDHFSFDKMVPMPAILERVISPPRQGDNGRTILYPAVRSADDPLGIKGMIEATEEEEAQIKACAPYTDWYKWANDNWGTKWRAHADEWTVSEDGTNMFITFDTAWDAPRPIFEKFAEFLDQVCVSYDITCVHEDGAQFERLHHSDGACFSTLRYIDLA